MAEWSLEWGRRAANSVQDLGRGVSDAIQKKVGKLADHPRLGKYIPRHEVFSLRISTPGGEYRAIYKPEDDKQTVLIILVASREEVYEILNR